MSVSNTATVPFKLKVPNRAIQKVQKKKAKTKNPKPKITAKQRKNKRKKNKKPKKRNPNKLNVCNETNYEPGTLLVTMAESNNKKMSLARLSDKTFALQRKKTMFDEVSSLLKKQNNKSLEIAYEPNIDDINQTKTRMKATKLSKRKRIKLERKLKFNEAMSKSSIARTVVLRTDINQCKKLTKLANKLLKKKNVESIALNHLAHANTVEGGNPNDNLFNNQEDYPYDFEPLWNLRQIHAPEAWEHSTGENTIVAVIDTGLDYNHPDIDDNVLRRRDLDNRPSPIDTRRDNDVVGDDTVGAQNDDHDPIDDHGHGTHVAGIIAAEGHNNIGIVGVAPNTKIMPIKALNSNKRGTAVDIGESIDFAVTNEADVINMSLGALIPFDTETDDINKNPDVIAIRAAIEAGITVIISARNDGINVEDDFADLNDDGIIVRVKDLYSNIPGVIAVGANTETGARASFSNFGTPDLVDISAPGGSNQHVNKPRNVNNYLRGVFGSAQLAFEFDETNDFLFGIDRGSSHEVEGRSILSLSSDGYRANNFNHILFNATTGQITRSQSSSDINFSPAFPEDVAYSVDLTGVENVNTNYRVSSGTSQAAPHVAGAAALILSLQPELTPEQVRELLVNTANRDNLPTDRPIGPRLDLANIFTAIDNLPDAPRLGFPSAGQSFLRPARPEFRWTGNANSYQLLVDDRVEYSGTNTRQQLAINLPVGQHTWQVRACSDINVCQNSETRTFNVTAFNETPTINSITVNQDRITAQWSSIPQPGITYNYNIVDISNSPSPRVAAGTNLTDTTASETLSPGSYRFNLQACFGTDCGAFTSQNFTIDELLGIPSLRSPHNGFSDDILRRPRFSWDPVDLASSYEIEIDGTIFPVTSTDDPVTYRSDTLPTGHHTWRVRACDDGGCGAFSTERGFDLDPFEQVPEINSPEIGFATDNNNIDLSWSVELGKVFSYQYNLINLKNDDDSRMNIDSATTNATVSGLAAGDYRFEVRACIEAGTECGAYATREFVLFPESNLDKAVISEGLINNLATLRKFKVKNAYRIYISRNGIRTPNAGWSPKYRRSRLFYRNLDQLVTRNTAGEESGFISKVSIIMQALIPISEFITDKDRFRSIYNYTDNGTRKSVTFVEIIDKMKALMTLYVADTSARQEYLEILESFQSDRSPVNPYSLVNYDRDELSSSVASALAENRLEELNALELSINSTDPNELELYKTTLYTLYRRARGFQGLIASTHEAISYFNSSRAEIDIDLLKPGIISTTLDSAKADLYYNYLLAYDQNNGTNYIDDYLRETHDFIILWLSEAFRPANQELISEANSATAQDLVTAIACAKNSSNNLVTRTIELSSKQEDGTTTKQNINIGFDVTCSSKNTTMSVFNNGDSKAIALSYLSDDLSQIKAAIINLDGSLINSWQLGNSTGKINSNKFGIEATDIDDNGSTDIVGYFYHQEDTKIYLETRSFNTDASEIADTASKILLATNTPANNDKELVSSDPSPRDPLSDQEKSDVQQKISDALDLNKDGQFSQEEKQAGLQAFINAFGTEDSKYDFDNSGGVSFGDFAHLIHELDLTQKEVDDFRKSQDDKQDPKDDKGTPGDKQDPNDDKKVKPGPRKTSPVINNPTKEDRVMIKDLLDDRKNNSGPSAAEAGTNHQVIKDILDVLDEDNNGILEKANLLNSYLETQVARNSQDLKYDFNKDGVVDRQDSTIMRSIYAQHIDGIRGDFKLVK